MAQRKLEEPVIWRLCWDSRTLSWWPSVCFVCLLSFQRVSWSSKSLIRNWQILYFHKLTWAEVWRMDWIGKGKNRVRDIIWVSQVRDESLNSGRVVKGKGTYLRNLEEVQWARHVVEWLWREKKGIKNSESAKKAAATRGSFGAGAWMFAIVSYYSRHCKWRNMVGGLLTPGIKKCIKRERGTYVEKIHC